MKFFRTFSKSESNGLRARRGFAIVSAIFLLLILAALGVAMMTLSTTQQTGSGLDVMGARAYQAARAGVEWGLYQRLVPNSTYCPTGAATVNSLAMPAGTTLSPFTVTVTCSAVANANTPTQITIRTIQSVACNLPTGGACSPGTTSGNTNFVQRVLQVSVQQ